MAAEQSNGSGSRPDPTARSTSSRSFGAEDVVWLSPALVAGWIVYAFYLVTNLYPAHGAGLYFAMAEAVSDHGYALPRTIPHYGAGEIPFAYPPLAFYGLALLRDATGIGPLAVSRWLPGLVVIASLVPTYLLARELLGSPRAAAVAATLVAANPQLLDWHITAGGVVRAPAFLLTVTGLYAGCRLFRWERPARIWLGTALACFLATVLTHPTYAMFFVVSYLVLYATLDRTLPGFIDGAIVGVGGLALASPWWLTVGRTHGFDVFLGALRTHGGVGGGVLARAATAPLGPVEYLLLLVLGLTVVAGLAAGRLFLVAWLVVVGLLHSQPRFTILVWTFLVVAVLLAVVRRLGAIRSQTVGRPSGGRPSAIVLLLAFAVVLGASTGVGYIRDDSTAPRLGITPNNVDGADLEAMVWVRSNTPPDATFVVLGDASEWFPLFAERTLLVSPWGTEWMGARTYARHVSLYRTVSFCDTARCLTDALAGFGVRPDYVYVPTDRYPVQGTPRDGPAPLARSLERSDRYDAVFENDGVTIFRRVDVEENRAAACEPTGATLDCRRVGDHRASTDRSHRGGFRGPSLPYTCHTVTG